MQHPWLAAAAAVVLVPFAQAQAKVVINEVLYDPVGADLGNEIVEIANLGDQPQDLTGWSFCVNAGPFQKTYTDLPSIVLQPGAMIRLHWWAAGTNSGIDYFTGTSPTLFGCGAPFELDNAFGSAHIYKITAFDCAGFFDPANIVDFVQWGGTPTLRESPAVQAGIWTTGAFIPLVPEGQSIAYDGDGDSITDFWQNMCPNLGSPNVGSGTAGVANYGAGCPGSAGVPAFTTKGGPPAEGNQSFKLSMANTISGAGAALHLGVGPTTIPIVGCNPGILTLPVISVPWVSGFDLPLALPCTGLPLGGTLYCQWIILDPGAIGGVAMSDGLALTF